MSTLEQAAPPGDGADAHWVVANDLARCSLWWNDTPPYPGNRVGLIGHYEARDHGVAMELLAHARHELVQRGCTLAIGPMDGSTWRRYRFITERGSEPAFFLEPDNAAHWPQQFEAQGFTPLAQYFSAVNDDLAHADPRVAAAWQRLAAEGVTIRAMDVTRSDAELSAIYAVSAIAFAPNFLYTPIGEAEFLQQYRRLLPVLQPELVLLAEREGRLIAYLFAVPDVLGPPLGTVIIKTVAVLPEQGGAGLGAVLIHRAHQVGRALGYRRAIHALMHESNRSRNISRHTARVFRRYTLFARQLTL